MKKQILMLIFSAAVLVLVTANIAAADECIECHTKISPGQVQDYNVSAHAENEIGCSDCHGEDHSNAEDFNKAKLPDEAVCAECHEDQFDQFSHGKHNFGWTSLNAIPATHMAPDELIEGGRGCGGCHNMGIKTEAQKKDQLEKGYRYQTNSCDECHTPPQLLQKRGSESSGLPAMSHGLRSSSMGDVVQLEARYALVCQAKW